jgi:hypothetical protein
MEPGLLQPPATAGFLPVGGGCGSVVSGDGGKASSAASAALRIAELGIRCVCFDFDLCILRIHSYGQKLTPAAVAVREPFQADFVDYDYFTALVPALQARGLAVYIASFGLYEVIQKYMDRAFGEGFFTRESISTPSVVGGVDGTSIPWGKVPQLLDIQQKLKLGKTDILFLDGAHACLFFTSGVLVLRLRMRSFAHSLLRCI